MPSALIGGQSGGVPLWSGAIFSGRYGPIGGIQLRVAKESSGSVYFGFSGGLTIGSGGNLSTGGMMDGMEVAPGDPFFIPNARLVSGGPAIFVTVPTTISGFARVQWEPY